MTMQPGPRLCSHQMLFLQKKNAIMGMIILMLFLGKSRKNGKNPIKILQHGRGRGVLIAGGSENGTTDLIRAAHALILLHAPNFI